MEWDTASLFPWHTKHMLLWEVLPGTPEHSHSPFFSLADGYYSRCRLADTQWRGRIISTDMLAPPLPIQPRVLKLPLLQGSLLAHVKLDERLGSLDLSCKVVSKQSAPTSRCSMPLCHSSCKFLHFALLNFPRFSPLISPACQVSPPSPALQQINCSTKERWS